MDEEGDRRHDAMANMVSGPAVAQDYLHDQLGWFDLDPQIRRCATGSSTTSTPTATCQQSDDLVGADATEEDRALIQKALGVVQKLDPPGVAARDLRESCCSSCVRDYPATSSSARLIPGGTWKTWSTIACP